MNPEPTANVVKAPARMIQAWRETDGEAVSDTTCVLSGSQPTIPIVPTPTSPRSARDALQPHDEAARESVVQRHTS